MSRENSIELRQLKIGYSTALLPPVDAAVSPGELVALIGANGMGKSTLIRSICGLQRVLDGQIFIQGEALSRLKRMQLAERISYVSTRPVRVGQMTVYELTALGRFPHTRWLGRLRSTDHQLIQRALEQVNMWSMRHKAVQECSDGERQRVMIARALSQETPLMILDEPTAFLDLANRYELIVLLSSLAHDSQRTVLFSTHDMHIALQKADKIWLLLPDGLIEGTPAELIRNKSIEKLFENSRVDFNATGLSAGDSE